MCVCVFQEPQFASVFWKEFRCLLGATASLSSGIHPQSNGQTECMNQELEKALRCTASRNPRAWAQHLLWVEYAHNSPALPQASLPFTVFMDTSHPCSLVRRETSPAHLPSPMLAVAAASSPRPVPLSLSLSPATLLGLTGGGLQPRPTVWARRCGYLPGTCHYGWNHANWHLVTLGPFPFRRSSARLQFSSSCRGL